MEKTHLFLLLLAGILFPVHAQRLEGVKSRSWVTRVQDNINNSTDAIGINSHFMKSGIGVDWGLMNTLPIRHFTSKKSEALPDSCLIIDGVAYEWSIDYHTDLYQPELLTLMDVKNEYAKDFPLRDCLFIINNVPITRDPRAFKIDKGFIVSVRGFAPNEIETLSENENLTSTSYIIRIFTKEHIMRKGVAIQKYKHKLLPDDFRFLIE